MCRLAAAALATAFGALASAAPAALADHPPPIDRAAHHAAASSRGANPGRGPGPGPSPVPAGANSPSPAGVGTVNPLAIRNPFCDGSQLRAAQRRNCATTGTPEARYPSSNYGFDVHIDTGLDNISGNFASMIAQLAGAIWTFCLFVLNIVLTVLGWAFGLSPLSDRSALGEIDRGLERFYGAFTAPWLIVAMVAIGAAALYRGVVKREVSASVAGTALSLALMLVALWIIFEPRATIGTLAGYTNDAALTVLAAPQSGSLSDPVADYGAATDEVFSAITLPAFAVLNFSDVDWALSKPDAELLETSNKYACLDAAYLAQIPPRRWAQLQALGDAGASVDCADLATTIAPPRTNAEIWLRSSVGSLAREKLWSDHTDDSPYSSYMAIQGEAGATTRLPLVLLVGLGIAGGICLLAWLALRIFVQSAVALVLVLSTPLALFMPAFGEAGRRAFVTWGSALVGAIVSKLVYAALLSVVLFATTAIARLVDGGGGIGATMGLLVMSALWWSVFLKREAILSSISVGRAPGEGGLRSALGLYATSRVGRQLVSPLTRPAAAVASRGRRSLAANAANRLEQTRRVADGELDRRGGRRLDANLERDRALLADQGARRAGVGAASRRLHAADATAEHQGELAARAPDPGARRNHERARQRALARAGGLRERVTELQSELRAHSPAERRAAPVVAAAEARERERGERWSPSQLSRARDAIRAEVDRPPSDPSHAWRVGLGRERYAALDASERQRVHGEVARQLRDDRRALGAIPDRPDGLVSRRAARDYRRVVTRRGRGPASGAAPNPAGATRRRRPRRRRPRGISR